MKKYKVGDIVTLYSWDELLKKINNGMKIKSKTWKLYSRDDYKIYGMTYQTFEKYLLDKKIRISSVNSDYSFSHESGVIVPFEFIKPVFSLPDELFQM